MGRLQLLPLLLLSSLLLLAVASSDKKAANETAVTAKDASGSGNRKEQRLNVLGNLVGGGLLGMLGGGGGGSSGGSSTSSGGGSSSGGGLGIQNGLKGLQTIQRFIARFQNVMGHPFSFRGVTDTMASLTGLLAAVGGGYLTYVSMVALFGSMLDPQNTAYQHAYPAPPHHYAPPQQLNIQQGVGSGPAAQGYNRRQSEAGSGLYFGSYDIGKALQSLTSINYPEASFKMLRIKEEACKQRAVCEFEKFLAKKGVASVILKGVSKKIPGMEKYLDAAYRGLANEDCSYAFSACPFTLGQSLLRSVGLN